MNITNSNFAVSEDSKKSKICESCGEGFLCGAETKSCWCFDLKLTDQNREELKSKFKNCLCKNCLENVESKIL